MSDLFAALNSALTVGLAAAILFAAAAGASRARATRSARNTVMNAFFIC